MKDGVWRYCGNSLTIRHRKNNFVARIVAKNVILEKRRGIHGEKLHIHKIAERSCDDFDYLEKKLFVNAIYTDGGSEEEGA